MKHMDTLKKIYTLYDRQIGSLDLACRKGCADCCTSNVTLTRLEAMLLLNGLAPEARDRMLARIANPAGLSGFRPALTTNGFAEACMSGAEPPEDAAEPETGACPLLEDDLCTVYDVRPFGCRCMVSTHSCRKSGQAEIDAYTLTVNTVFLQFIEHIDTGGCFGNLADMLPHLAPDRRWRQTDAPLIPNRPIPVLMVPAGHREQIRPLLAALNDLLAGLK